MRVLRYTMRDLVLGTGCDECLDVEVVFWLGVRVVGEAGWWDDGL